VTKIASANLEDARNLGRVLNHVILLYGLRKKASQNYLSPYWVKMEVWDLAPV